MYLHLGQDVVVKEDTIVGIFDIENTTTSRLTRDFLKLAEKNDSVINVVTDIPKSFVVCNKNNKTVIYLTQVSPSTLLKRAEGQLLDAELI
ncbi:MAG: DUF370 domain-containing protein [Bacillota bacterium]|nr:DUF370 domain-containing protein [Bacillota bacterium]